MPDKYREWFIADLTADEPEITKSSKIGIRILKKWLSFLRIPRNIIINPTEESTTLTLNIPKEIKLKKHISVLIVEDDLDAREAIIDQILSFKDYEFTIDEPENLNSAKDKLARVEQKRAYYDFMFFDISLDHMDFGGKIDSGFDLIEKAFEICPIVKIATYSAQFRIPALSPRHQELTKKGCIVYTFDKDHQEKDPENWFKKGFEKLLAELQEEQYLWTIWENHELIRKLLPSIALSNDPFEQANRRNEIFANLETILFLLSRKKDFREEYIIFRLIITLYHRALEIVCEGVKV